MTQRECINCGSCNLAKNGKTSKGVQKYRPTCVKCHSVVAAASYRERQASLHPHRYNQCLGCLYIFPRKNNTACPSCGSGNSEGCDE